MNHYPFNPSDYMMATAHLEPSHDLCYRRCLDLYYDTEAPLANAKQSLSKRLRVNEDVLSEVLAEFFEEHEDGWHHKRCDEEIAKYQAKSAKAKKAGSLGGMAKKAAPEADAKRTLSKRLASASNQNQNQNQNHSTPPVGGESLPFHSPAFAEAWGKWRRHRSEIRKPLKPTMEAEQLAELAAMGELRAVACLLHTIAKGWQGLREPEAPTNHARPRNAAYDASTATAGLTPDQIGKF
jgi:uncharacterized protein YdaU (DUF1376 family)